MKKSILVLVVLVLGIVAGLGYLLFARLDFSPPVLNYSPRGASLGAHTVLNLALTDSGAGIKSVEVDIVQGARQAVPLKVDYPGASLFQGTGVHAQNLQAVVEPRKLGLTQGPAELRITVRDASWWHFFAGNEVSVRQPVMIRWQPPRVEVLSGIVHINRGGTGMIIYRAEAGTVNGVVSGAHFYPGFPTQLGAGIMCAYFAWPGDTDTPPDPFTVVARDSAGNEGKAGFYYKLHDKAFRSDQVELSEQFLATKVAQLVPAGAAPNQSPVANFLVVNRTLRAANHKTIAEVCSHSQPVQLWKGAFLRMNNAAPMAAFGDRRGYLYHGQEVDRQIHLGVDLAALAAAPVEAANSGVVVWAAELGIYGNCVIIDHGQGVFSLYGHLSSISVAPGQRVAQRTIIGRTGQTGLAGGDHLHFSMLIDGVFVNPVEWWDPHWIKDDVELKYAQAKDALAPPPPLPGPRPVNPNEVIR